MADTPLPVLVDSPSRRSSLTSTKSGLSRRGSAVSVSGLDIALQRINTPVLRRPTFIHRATDTNEMAHAAGMVRFPAAEDLEAQRPVPAKPKANLFGFRTNYKPFYLVGMGAAGNWLYGTGTVAMVRGIFPRRPIAPPGTDESTLPPVLQPLFGKKSYSLGLGTASTIGGVVLAVTSCVLGYQDARKLARKIGGASPNYIRPNWYFGVHMGAILLSVAYKFTGEALRDKLSTNTVWAASVPGLIGQAAFAVTQAQAFSSCELVNGKMPLKHRSEIGFSARFLISAWVPYAVLASIPYSSQYGREAVRLTAVTAATLAYSLPLTTSRISRQNNVAGPLGEIRPTSWRSLEVLGIYFLGRVMVGYGPDLLQQGVFTGSYTEERLTTNHLEIFVGASMLALGTAICTAAIMIFRFNAAAYNIKRANWLSSLALFALLCQELYRGLNEYAADNDETAILWAAIVPGIVGTGLRFAVLPALWCYSELFYGDNPLPYRYHWTEFSRAMGQFLFGTWGAMSAIPGFSSYGRETVGVLAGIFATLGMALPTTTSLRQLPQYAWPLSPGMTPPAAERGNPFEFDGV